MEEKYRKPTPGELKISICKGENDDKYTGGIRFGNTDVLIEALAVLIKETADELGVTVDLVYAKLATLLFATESIGKEDEHG